MVYRGIFGSMLYGLIGVLFIAVAFSFVISLILSFSSLTEASFSWFILIVSFLALFIGGMIAGVKAKQKGWMVGAGTALLFTVITFLIQYLGYNSTFTMEQYLYHGGYLLASVFGGIIGVNVGK
ncbi:MAG: TIGR04086 family membrane protein [Bacillaceae bacterium]|uniref:TIGR04086 family membrane protein n=1 Tax=Alkalihalobacterium chitinilyticum TaxID=2980103 RepID=A0ABT5VI82_9BACI|nr:TIGR04086 family membrane protein [Alkalihalobacterium chitinilyticum]MDE5415022.1 TIGR04086 family membrane protein [Alkalihalobacterium chitinilyticum]MEB1808040.1 TIGR04086 family membrane protein [Bacillaceae bacterium]